MSYVATKHDVKLSNKEILLDSEISQILDSIKENNLSDNDYEDKYYYREEQHLVVFAKDFFKSLIETFRDESTDFYDEDLADLTDLMQKALEESDKDSEYIYFYYDYER
jgi:hypothetical protein